MNWYVEVFEVPGGAFLYRMGRFATWREADEASHRAISATRSTRIIQEEGA